MRPFVKFALMFSKASSNRFMSEVYLRVTQVLNDEKHVEGVHFGASFGFEWDSGVMIEGETTLEGVQRIYDGLNMMTDMERFRAEWQSVRLMILPPGGYSFKPFHP